MAEKSILTAAEMKGMAGKCNTKRRIANGKANPHSCVIGERCCMANVLRSQPNFLEQKLCLHEVVKKVGHEMLMLPICHPELNPIEDFWNACKRYTRAVCDYEMKGLRVNVPLSFLSFKVGGANRLSCRIDTLHCA